MLLQPESTVNALPSASILASHYAVILQTAAWWCPQLSTTDCASVLRRAECDAAHSSCTVPPPSAHWPHLQGSAASNMNCTDSLFSFPAIGTSFRVCFFRFTALRMVAVWVSSAGGTPPRGAGCPWGSGACKHPAKQIDLGGWCWALCRCGHVLPSRQMRLSATTGAV